MIYLISISGQVIAGASNVEDLEKVVADAPMLQQKMKPRHLQMIAVGAVDLPSDFRVLIPLTSGGSIGTGLFVGSGSALHHGGPAGVLIAWILFFFFRVQFKSIRAEPHVRPYSSTSTLPKALMPFLTAMISHHPHGSGVASIVI